MSFSNTDLAEIDAQVWRDLILATKEDDHALRFLSLATTGVDNRANTRVIVLRRVDAERRILEFHTDVRSDKWAELLKSEYACVLGYSPANRQQMRFHGRVRLYDSQHVFVDETFRALAPWTQSTYAGGTPKESVGAPVSEESAGCVRNFGIILFECTSLDWFELRRQGNKRALFDYQQTSTNLSARWVNP